MAKETKIINKPEISIPDTVTTTVSGNVSIDDSTPIDTAVTGTVDTNATIQGTPNVAVTGNVAIDDSTPIDTAVTGTVTANSTIQNATLAVTKSGTWDVDSITGTVTTNATIQNSTLATKGKTSYSDTTSDPDYWLGLYNDNLLIKKAVEISASEIITSATFQSTAVDTANGALQITEFLDGSGNVTGRNSQVITWTQTLQDLALPGITDIAISASGVVSGASENDLIGNLTATGAVGAVTWEIVTNASSLANVRIDDQKLEVGAGGLTSSVGDYVLNIKATDTLGKVRSENFTISVASSYSSTASLNLTSFNYNSLKKGVYLNSSVADMTNCNSFAFTNTNGWAWTMWFKSNLGGTTGTTTEAFIQCASDGWANRTTLWIDYVASDDRRMTIYTELNNSADIKIEWDADAWLDDEWHQLIMCYGGVSDYQSNGTDSFKFYIDGTVQSQLSANETGTPDPTNANHDGLANHQGITLMNFHNTDGSSASPTAGSVNCYIDEFTMWNKGLSSSEITEFYNSGGLVDVSDLSFFSTSDCGVWLKCGDATNDAVDDTTNSGQGNLYSAGTNSIQDSSGNDNHWFLCVTTADAVTSTGISTSDFAPDD